MSQRSQTPSKPGVSGTVFDHVAGKLDLAFDDLGEQRVKNIAKPVRIYRVRSDAVSGSCGVIRPAVQRVLLKMSQFQGRTA